MKLSDKHRKQLIALLERLPELATEKGRRNILTLADLGEIAPKIDLSGSQFEATSRIVSYLEAWGRLASQQEALGLFLSAIKDLVGIEQRDFLNLLLKEYEMMTAIAPTGIAEQPQLPGQNQTLGQEGKLSIKEIKAEAANTIDRTIGPVGNYNEDSQNANVQGDNNIVFKKANNVYIGSEPQPEVSGEPEPAIQWRDICRQILAEQKHLTTNELMQYEENCFELDEIHVPLALVERKKTASLEEEYSPEQGSRLYEPEYEEKQRFQHQQFLTDILGGGKGKSQGKRIAIIGEPGAGKTTLARKVAFWLLDNTTYLPILIAAADLPEPEANRDFLEEYLLEKWLKNAVERVTDLTERVKVKFKDKFRDGKAWLLLDGIDEMPARRLEALRAIQKQLSGWVGQGRVVLTCRLNLWEANRNALASEFEIYRTLEFSYGDGKTGNQVGEFIGKWFQREPELGEKLRREMERSEKRRIKDLAKNPLRLALLCSTWRLWKDLGGLPDTKAKLYKGFVDKFYSWKDREFPSTPTERDELNRALGELAKVAIDRDESRFRLKQSLVSRVLGQESDRLFELATQLGWLNKVGLAAESPDEEVYAFYHPTFQEYFAATAIEDWHFFLNHVPDEPERGNYRIFEPQWKQVILLWLGRDDVLQEEKEQFIEALVSFEDKCNDFYKYRAYFLAAAGIAEFQQCRRANEIVKQLFEWGFTGNRKYDDIENGARIALEETDTQRAISALVQLLNSDENESIRKKAAYELGKIGEGNPEAISAMVQWLNSAEDEDTRRQAAYSLGAIGVGNPKAILAIVQLLQYAKNESTRLQAAESLGKIGAGSFQAKSALVYLVKSAKHQFTRKIAAYNLEKIDPANSESISIMVRAGNYAKNKPTRSQAADSLLETYMEDPRAISIMVQWIESAEDELTRCQGAALLAKIDPGNFQPLSILVQLAKFAEDEFVGLLAADSLKEIILSINHFVQIVKLVRGRVKNEACYEIAWYCAENIPYPDFYRAWHQGVPIVTPEESTTESNYKNLEFFQNAIQIRP
ncbi:MAG: AAA family ATPase [Oscillatoria sp. SIO1A7]|nr:AAA family ATPase [Oscillatoria sp. SIO1A7]